jgi:peptidyl-prolyl cis-trans isomerase C
VIRLRLAGAAALVGVVGLLPVLSSCSTVSPDAATVNGDHVKRSDFQSELSDWEHDTNAQNALSAQGLQILGSGANATVSTSFAAQLLGAEIQQKLMDQRLRQLGLPMTEADQATARQGLAGSGSGSDQGFSSFSGTVQQFFVDNSAMSAAFQRAVATDAEVQKRYDAPGDTYTEVCASHILVATADEAAQVEKDLAGGTSFADEAKAKSTDQASAGQGGQLLDQNGHCFTKDEYDTQFDQTFVAAVYGATPGKPTQPVQTQFGFHVILVDHIGKAPIADVRSTIASDIASDELTKLYDTAKITVDPRFGTWNANGRRVDPSTPGLPAPSTVPSTVAGSPSPNATTATTAAPAAATETTAAAGATTTTG